MIATAKKRKSRYSRKDTELPPEKLALMDKLSHVSEYIERDGHYLLTEKAFQKLLSLEAEAEQPVHNAGAEPVPEGKSAPAPDLSMLRFGVVPTGGGPTEKFLKVMHKVQNPRILMARDEAGALYHVQVGDSANFVPGMGLNAIPHPTEPAFWKCVGGIPRFLGRW